MKTLRFSLLVLWLIKSWWFSQVVMCLRDLRECELNPCHYVWLMETREATNIARTGWALYHIKLKVVPYSCATVDCLLVEVTVRAPAPWLDSPRSIVISNSKLWKVTWVRTAEHVWRRGGGVEPVIAAATLLWVRVKCDGEYVCACVLLYNCK